MNTTPSKGAQLDQIWAELDALNAEMQKVQGKRSLSTLSRWSAPVRAEWIRLAEQVREVRSRACAIVNSSP